MLLSAAHALLAQFVGGGAGKPASTGGSSKMTKWEVYNAIEGMGGRATWAQLEERFDNQSRFSLCLSRLVRDGLLRRAHLLQGAHTLLCDRRAVPRTQCLDAGQGSDNDNNNNSNNSIIINNMMDNRRGSAAVTAAAAAT